MSYKIRREIVGAFAIHVRDLGFEVYLGEAGTHGFITNGDRVVSFQHELFGGVSVHGNYEPREKSGTGWCIAESGVTPDKHEVEEWLSAYAPNWIREHGPYTTKEQYLKRYQASSKFTQI